MNVTSSTGVVRIEAVLGNTSDGMFAKCFGTRPFDRFRCPEIERNVKGKTKKIFQGRIRCSAQKYNISELQEHGIPFVYTRDRMTANTVFKRL